MANGHQASGSASDTANVKQELAGDAERLKNTARDQVENRVQEGERQAAQTARATSSAIDRAADELRRDENAPDWLASAFSSAARQVSALAGQLENTSPQEIARGTSDFARSNPAAFLTASAALGFAAARFFRAGAEYRHDEQTSSPGGASYTGGGMGATGSSYGAGNTTTMRSESSYGTGGASSDRSAFFNSGGASTGGATTSTGGASTGGLTSSGATTSGATTGPGGDRMGDRR